MEDMGIDLLSRDEVESRDLKYILSKSEEEFQILGGRTLLFTGATGFEEYFFLK